MGREAIDSGHEAPVWDLTRYVQPPPRDGRVASIQPTCLDRTVDTFERGRCVVEDSTPAGRYLRPTRCAAARGNTPWRATSGH
jgi:hypothetical protein